MESEIEEEATTSLLSKFGHKSIIVGIEIGIFLRDAMFANGILTNSEVWHSITEEKKHKRLASNGQNAVKIYNRSTC